MKKILFPLPTDINNVNYSSGSLYSIYCSLKNHFEVIPVGPLKNCKSNFQGGLNKLFNYHLSPWRFATAHSWRVVSGYSNQLQKIVETTSFDAIFSTSTLYAAAVVTDKPKFCYTDFSFFNALRYYPFATNLFPSSEKEALQVDKYCFEQHRITFLASEWARKTTLDEYKLDSQKIISIARGANLISNYDSAALEKKIQKRISSTTKKFLFVGVDWQRKGGNIAFETVKELNNQGLNVILQVVGCYPPRNIKNSSLIEVYPFLNRNIDTDLLLLRNLFEEAYVYIMPTEAEAMGIVFAEASSFGLPSISYNTGGVNAAIEDNKTGKLFEIGTSSNLFANYLSLLMNNNEMYTTMSKNAFIKYSEDLNWDSIAYKIKTYIDPYLK